MNGTSYEIDFLFFPSHVVFLWLISELALAKLIFSISGIAVSGANFCVSCAHL